MTLRWSPLLPLVPLVPLVLLACAAGGAAALAPPAPAPTDAAASRRVEQLREEVRERPCAPALYALAVYAARLGRADEALVALARLDAMAWDAGVLDDDFPTLSAQPAYRTLAARFAAREPVVHRSVPGFTIAERGLHAEGIAYDAGLNVFYVGSTTTGRILGVDAGRSVRDVAHPGGREVLGLKVGGPERSLWAVVTDDENPDGESCLIAIEPPTGRVLRRACVPAAGHELNDLAVASDGTVYATDSTAGAVLRLPPAASHLEALVPDGRLRGANGIALGAGDAVLLVAHGRGIARITLPAGTLGAVENASGSPFVGIDGMALRDRTIFAIANTYGHPRISRIELDATLTRAERVDLLETASPVWDEPTTGALGPDGFYYVADSQLSSGAPPRETVVLKIPY